MAHVTPANAETALPPKTAHGCAIGLAGSANTIIAVAPMGATSQVTGTLPSNSQRLNTAVTARPRIAPKNARQSSLLSTGNGDEKKPEKKFLISNTIKQHSSKLRLERKKCFEMLVYCAGSRISQRILSISAKTSLDSTVPYASMHSSSCASVRTPMMVLVICHLV